MFLGLAWALLYVGACVSLKNSKYALCIHAVFLAWSLHRLVRLVDPQQDFQPRRACCANTKQAIQVRGTSAGCRSLSADLAAHMQPPGPDLSALPVSEQRRSSSCLTLTLSLCDLIATRLHHTNQEHAGRIITPSGERERGARWFGEKKVDWRNEERKWSKGARFYVIILSTL